MDKVGGISQCKSFYLVNRKNGMLRLLLTEYRKGDGADWNVSRLASYHIQNKSKIGCYLSIVLRTSGIHIKNIKKYSIALLPFFVIGGTFLYKAYKTLSLLGGYQLFALSL
jgi:hypothetical protein